MLDLIVNVCYFDTPFEYMFSIFIYNLIIYIVLIINLFLILFSFNNLFLTGNNFLSEIPASFFLKNSIIIILFSLAGVPPFIGFTSKFIFILILLQNTKTIFLLIFLFINFYIMYFYLQNLRYLASNKESSIGWWLSKNLSIYSFKLHYTVIIFNFFNIFGLFFVEFFLNVIFCISSFLYLI